MSRVGADAVVPTTVGSAFVRRRKLLLMRRQALSFVNQSFERLWKQHFRQHDPVTLRLQSPAQGKAEAYWEGESWKRAARWYHENRQGRTLITEADPQQVRRVRRLLSNDVSLHAVWRELNAPENRPTPRTTVEAIMWCVRERGLPALKESENIERLLRCDAAAKAEINRRIAHLLAAKEMAA
jgi:hypothetical protein